MRIARFQQGREIGQGMVVGDRIAPFGGGREIVELVSGGADILRRLEAEALSAETIALADVRLLPPGPRPSKFLAIGMNYRKHADEAEAIGIARPERQFWFNKQVSCVSGPFDPIDPGVSTQVDYEVELGVVIGKAAKRVTPEQAPEHVFGYLVVNDVSARDWQYHSPTFTIGKSFDTHGPIGPWLTTAANIADPHGLHLRTFVNGELRQSSSTREMVFDIWEQISYLSQAFTLEPGDIIATGTPEGVGVAMKPARFLQSGDVVRCEIDGLGYLENRVR